MLLLLLAAASASAFAQPKHVPQQGQIVETHTEYGAGSSCHSHDYCPKTAATILVGGHVLKVIGASAGGYYPGKLDSGITVTVDFEKNPELWIVDGGTRLKFNVQDFQ